MLNFIAIASTLFGLWALFHKKIINSKTWHATITPLASIIGSGFLVSAPLLLLATGKWAVLIMLVIVIFAYALGSSVRFNIKHLEPLLIKMPEHGIYRLEEISRIALGLAYIISVTFYLKLLSAFALRGIGFENILYENILTSSLLLFIGIMGKIRGLSILEFFEIYSVNTKLAIIFAIMVTHFLYNAELFTQGKWILKAYPHESWWLGFRKILGMLIIIQGFETSRYIGDEYSASLRIKTMKYAQYISGVIYVFFIALAMVVFNDIHQISETTVINLCRIVAPALALLLIIAAIMSQFSAAIADLVGSGGLISEATRKKISVNNSYLLITLITLVLTWSVNIYRIIPIASKAFAIYYASQIILTLIAIISCKCIKQIFWPVLFYSFLLFMMILVIVLGIPVE